MGSLTDLESRRDRRGRLDAITSCLLCAASGIAVTPFTRVTDHRAVADTAVVVTLAALAVALSHIRDLPRGAPVRRYAASGMLAVALVATALGYFLPRDLAPYAILAAAALASVAALACAVSGAIGKLLLGGVAVAVGVAGVGAGIALTAGDDLRLAIAVAAAGLAVGGAAAGLFASRDLLFAAGATGAGVVVCGGAAALATGHDLLAGLVLITLALAVAGRGAVEIAAGDGLAGLGLIGGGVAMTGGGAALVTGEVLIGGSVGEIGGIALAGGLIISIGLASALFTTPYLYLKWLAICGGGVLIDHGADLLATPQPLLATAAFAAGAAVIGCAAFIAPGAFVSRFRARFSLPANDPVPIRHRKHEEFLEESAAR